MEIRERHGFSCLEHGHLQRAAPLWPRVACWAEQLACCEAVDELA
jgi:hypothetical protein